MVMSERGVTASVAFRRQVAAIGAEFESVLQALEAAEAKLEKASATIGEMARINGVLRHELARELNLGDGAEAYIDDLIKKSGS